MENIKLPPAMRAELLQAPTAHEAETVFNTWADCCYIEHKDRARVYVNAGDF